jgi:hypothetical protein
MTASLVFLLGDKGGRTVQAIAERVEQMLEMVLHALFATNAKQGVQ